MRGSKWKGAEKVHRGLMQIISKRIGDTGWLACKMATGNNEGSPFDDEMISEGVELIIKELKVDDKEAKLLRKILRYQPFRLYLIATVAQRMGGPDWRILASATDSFATGVPVGIDGMSRTPAVYERKKKWRSGSPCLSHWFKDDLKKPAEHAAPYALARGLWRALCLARRSI